MDDERQDPTEPKSEPRLGRSSPGGLELANWLPIKVDTLPRGDRAQWVTSSARRLRLRQRSVWASVAVAMIGISGAIGVVHSDNPATGTGRADSAVAPVHPPPVAESESMVTGTGPGCGPSAIGPDAALLGPGRQPSSGAEVIAAFEASYYHARDGERARRFVALGAAVPDAATIQAGIDSVAPGTLYCARIRLLIPGLYSVEATETSPTAPESTWQQRISTTEIDGRAAITAIAAG